MTALTHPELSAIHIQAPRYPSQHWLWGSLRTFFADPIALLSRLPQEYPDLVRLRFGPMAQYMLQNADYARHVLVNNQKNYQRPARFRSMLALLGPPSLFSSEGDYWLRQRRMLQPAFHRQRLIAFGAMMTAATQQLLAEWESRSDESQPLSVENAMIDLTLNVVGKALFSLDMQAAGRGAHLKAAFAGTTHFLNYRFQTLLAPPLFVPTQVNRRFKQARAAVDQLVQAIIDERRRDPSEHHDFLQMLLELRYEDSGQGMTDEQLRSECAAFFFAGHETTANTLTWIFYLLAAHPAATASLHTELAAVLGGRTPTVDDLGQLTYTRQVVEEAMRLYPAAWVTSRQATAADQLGPYTLPAGSQVMINITGIHRHPAYWENPDAFDPDRFTPERSAQRPKHAYLPFGLGPRMCIGNQFAMMEAQLLLATIAQRYQTRLTPGYTPKPYPLFTLCTADGMPLLVESRPA